MACLAAVDAADCVSKALVSAGADAEPDRPEHSALAAVGKGTRVGHEDGGAEETR